MQLHGIGPTIDGMLGSMPLLRVRIFVFSVVGNCPYSYRKIQGGNNHILTLTHFPNEDEVEQIGICLLGQLLKSKKN